MGAFVITGGIPLCGEITIEGAKNAVLPILAAALAAGGKSVLRNCPRISDVENALRILEHLGCCTSQKGSVIRLNTYSAGSREIPRCLMQKMRGAVIFLGALLCRYGEAKICQPGGCRLGSRPLDLHLMGLRRMGYDCRCRGDEIICREETLHGCTIALPFPSVGATENLIRAALRCPEEIILCNAAKEPEIEDMIVFLQKCGADIRGKGTSVLRMRGGKALHGAEHTVIPDRMEAATYLCAAAATRGNLHLKNVCPGHLEAVTAVLLRGGCRLKATEKDLTLFCRELSCAGPVRTAPYDGFPTDAQAPMMAALATARGVSVIEENIFSDRFRHVPALRDLGAKIRTAGKWAVVEGTRALRGTEMEATDLRGGAAMVIGALAAEGRSRITETAHMKRGYAGMVRKLRACGAQIEDTE